MKPVLFSDIDGVLNIFPPARKGKTFENGKHRNYWNEWKKQEFSIVDGDKTLTYPFIHSPEMVEALLSIQDRIDIVLLTTWQEHTQTLLPELLGLDAPLPYLPNTGGRADFLSRHNQLWWKVEALSKEIAANPRPFLWVDDIYYKELRVQVQGISKRNGVPGDMIRSYEAYGITKQMLDQIEQFFFSK